MYKNLILVNLHTAAVTNKLKILRVVVMGSK